jgi:hypothetical protein
MSMLYRRKKGERVLGIECQYSMRQSPQQAYDISFKVNRIHIWEDISHFSTHSGVLSCYSAVNNHLHADKL